MKTIIKIRRFSLATAVIAVAVLTLLSLNYVEPVKASPNTPVPVGATAGDFFITPSSVDVSGDHFVMFNVTNVSGVLVHEFVVIRLKKGQTYNNLPISTDPSSEYFGGVDENALGPFIMGEIEDLPPGGSGAVTLGLPPGDYALICNLPGHYAAGMRSPFNTAGH